MKRSVRTWCVAAIAAAATAFAASGNAATIIGNWESGTPEGWIDWGSAQAPIAPPRFGFNGTGATVGTGAIQFNLANGYTQWMSIKLQQGSNGVDEWRDDFLANAKVAFDLTLVASEQAVATGNDYASIGVYVNGPGYGFTNQGNPESVTPFTGYGGTNAFNPQQLVGTQTSTWVWDIADTHDGVGTNIDANPGYVELIWETYSNGAVAYHVDNVRLYNIPEPTSVALIGVGAIPLVRRRRRRA